MRRNFYLKIRISDKEQQYLDYLKQQKPDEYRGSWYQIIRHIIDKNMVADMNKDSEPFVYKQPSDTSNNSSDSDSDNSDNNSDAE